MPVWRHGDRVTLDGRTGIVSFTRGEFVRVYWDDGTNTDEWGASLTHDSPGQQQAA